MARTVHKKHRRKAVASEWPLQDEDALASPAEIFQDQGWLVVRVELPRLTKDELSIELRDEALRIEGKHRVEREEQDGPFLRREWSHGRFERVVPLPYHGLGVAGAKARYHRGVLQVSIPLPPDGPSGPRIPLEGEE